MPVNQRVYHAQILGFLALLLFTYATSPRMVTFAGDFAGILALRHDRHPAGSNGSRIDQGPIHVLFATQSLPIAVRTRT